MQSALIQRSRFQQFLSLFLLMSFLASQAGATCGGGGGGGMGGMGGGVPEKVYQVPWRLINSTEVPPKGGLLLYWFPTSQQEIDRSSLRNSQMLTLYSQQCVTMGIVDSRTEIGQKLVAGESLPLAVLVSADGKLIDKAENKKGFLKVDQVEKMVETEVKRRESSIKERLSSARDKIKAGDNQAAIEQLRAIVEEKCMFPSKAKDAAKELKKLGVNDVAEIPAAPNFDRRVMAQVGRAMQEGLREENAAHYPEAERLYQSAHELDPADPTPLRYLGELYRHHIGDWEKARQTFNAILGMPSDPLARAVALHGLGKMTIHEGDFKKGLALMEASVREYPLALAYRNLAVYWNSEGDSAKADSYTRLALALDPKDPYNLVFAAAFMAGNGHADEALKIARENEGMLPASYNLAAIYAQAGQRGKALSLLKRHFFQYERYQAVRSKEMMEARVDAVFASLKSDPEFVALTSDADGKLPWTGMNPRPGGQ